MFLDPTIEEHLKVAGKVPGLVWDGFGSNKATFQSLPQNWYLGGGREAAAQAGKGAPYFRKPGDDEVIDYIFGARYSDGWVDPNIRFMVAQVAMSKRGNPTFLTPSGNELQARGYLTMDDAGKREFHVTQIAYRFNEASVDDIKLGMLALEAGGIDLDQIVVAGHRNYKSAANNAKEAIRLERTKEILEGVTKWHTAKFSDRWDNWKTANYNQSQADANESAALAGQQKIAQLRAGFQASGLSEAEKARMVETLSNAAVTNEHIKAQADAQRLEEAKFRTFEKGCIRDHYVTGLIQDHLSQNRVSLQTLTEVIRENRLTLSSEQKNSGADLEKIAEQLGVPKGLILDKESAVYKAIEERAMDKQFPCMINPTIMNPIMEKFGLETREPAKPKLDEMPVWMKTRMGPSSRVQPPKYN